MSRIEKSLSDSVWEINPRVRFRRMFDEAVLIHQEHAEALVLNETAVSFLELCDGQKTLGQIAHLLMDKYDTTYEKLSSDLAHFLNELSESQIIHAVQGPKA